MFDSFIVKSSFHDYLVEFTDRLVADLGEVLEDGDVLVVDTRVREAHGERLGEILGRHPVLEIEASEREKSFERIGESLEELVARGFRRGNRLVAVGGGVVQDITAFIATVIYRGVTWYFVPTTLLAQGDSCIGGKSSINFRGYKNLLGSFLPPRKILIDVTFLESLPDVQVTSGIGEILHFLIYSSEEDFAYLEEHLQEIRTDPARMKELIRRSLAIKKAVVEVDEFDTGVRQLFNYGHSFGHAIEAVTDYGIPHGIAVSFGMDIANYVSVGIEMAEPAFRERVRAVTSEICEGFSIRRLDLDGIFAALRRDKKNIGNDVYVILTEGFGGTRKTKIDLDGREGELIREYFASEAS